MFLGDINKAINEHKIPPELVLNADQTPYSYVSVGIMTMAPGNSSSVPIKGLTDKRSIPFTFVISLSGNFLPMQIIYQGKTIASQPRNFQFPKGFLVSQNPKHYSNEMETLSLIDKVIKPYVDLKRKELKLQPTQLKSAAHLGCVQRPANRQGFFKVSITEYRGCFSPCQHDAFFSAS